MGIGIDTVGFYATDAGATGKAATVSAGDSFTVRYFGATQQAKLAKLFRQDSAGTQGFVQLKSPRLANDTTGIKIRAKQNPAVELLPCYGAQQMYSGDALTVNISGHTAATTAGHTTGGLQIYYSTLSGANANVKMWGTISGMIANIFTQDVLVKTGALGAWKTVLSNATSDLMRATTTYALLGYTCSVAYAMVGLRAQETSTLRICGPGTTVTEDTSTYFVKTSNDLGLPYIPVVNANNRGNINVTAQSVTATTTGHVSLIWAQLS